MGPDRPPKSPDCGSGVGGPTAGGGGGGGAAASGGGGAADTGGGAAATGGGAADTGGGGIDAAIKSPVLTERSSEVFFDFGDRATTVLYGSKSPAGSGGNSLDITLVTS